MRRCSVGASLERGATYLERAVMDRLQNVRRAVLVVSLGLVSALIPLAADAASAQGAPARGNGNVSARLEELAAGAGVARSDAGENRSVDLPASGAGSLLHQPDGSFLANARLSSVDAATKTALERAGARIIAESAADHLVTVAIEPADIDAVGAVDGVEWLEEVLTPAIHRADLAGVASTLQEGGVATSAACGSRVVSEGDTHLGAAAARTTYGVDGTGIKIGVLSDSYNNVGGAATDVSNGELPGAGNPCGYTTPVVVQSELASGGTDEARGMAQAVHDLAPGATILVATAFNGDVDFAQQIRDLATAGAKVIVDDISYFNEPVYQDGIIAKAIADVTASGVTYFSSAANSNTIIGGKDVASYEAQTYRPTTCPGTAISSSYGDPDCHDWDPGAGADAGNVINVDAGGTVQFKLGYNEPQYGITTDLDLFLIDNATSNVLATSVTDNKVTTKQAYELLSYTNSSGAAKAYRLVVGRYQTPGGGVPGLGGTPRLKVIMQTDTGVTGVQWNTSSGGDVIGPTSYGHNMMRGAGSIAAIRYNSTTAPETFSSRGPATYCWNPVVGTAAATALASCVSDTIDVAATDGAANSFFGQLSSGVWRFYGTSQAAPHAAAIAVLQLAARPCRTPAEILAAQRSSGIAVGSYGVDAVGGGRVNASASISGLAACSTTPGVPTGVSAVPGNAKATVSWTAPSATGTSAISGYRVTPYIGATAQTPVVFNSTTTTQTVTGLTNGTAYTFTVAATNASGTGTDSTASSAVTPRTVPGAPTGVNGTPGNTTVDLTWTAPASNGGSAITGYTVTPSIGATAQTPVVFNSTATTQTITGLTNGTAYTFKVKATNAAGSSADSAASAPITPAAPLTAPGAPTAVSGIPGNTTVDLSWTAPASNGGSAITGYTVTPSIGATAQTPVVFNSTATAQTITGLTNGTAYTFKVKATNGVGPGADSAASSAITPRTVPGAPTSVTGTPGNTTVDLTWTAPASNGGSPITGYSVTPYIGIVAQSDRVFSSAATTQTITGLTNGTSYTFKVRATNAAGTGTDSGASLAVTPRSLPGAPTGVSGSPGNTTVALSWTAPASDGGSAITGYRVTPFIGATAQTSVVFNSTATSQTITGLSNGTAYTFKVAAMTAGGTGTDSTASSAITPRTVPGAPTAVTGTAGNTVVDLSWTAPGSNGGAAITGYTVTPFIGATAQTPVVFNSTATAQTITGLTNGTAYTFKVKATNAAGSGADSAASSAVTPRSLPGSPTAVSGIPGNATVDLSWTAPASTGGSAITGYTVTPSIGATAQTPIVFNSTATTQTITGLTNGTAYTFTVAATTSVGTGTNSAASSAITPRTVPGAPTGVSGTPGNAQVGLTWTAPASTGGSAITGYTITPSIGATAQSPIVFNSTATSQTITGLTNGTAYTFKVKATNAAGSGADSAASSAVTPRSLPSAPTNVSGTPGNGQVDLTWTAPTSNGGSAITGYRVTPYIGATAQTPVPFGSTATSQTITGLTNGSAYTFTVAATTAAGTGADSPASSAITPRTVPGAPTGVSGTPGNTQVDLTWTAPASTGGSAIAGYAVTPFIGATAQTPVVFNSTATAQTITGLTNGTAYTFKVKATNAAGTGVDSGASAAITPAAPGVPWKPFTSWNAMVDRFYLDMLGRLPTSSERSSRAAQLTAGTLTPGGLVAALRLDPDNVNNVDTVTRLYRAYFLRIPDKGGLTYWIKQRRVNGKKLNAISDFFASSSEFKAKYGKLTNRAFVQRVYQNVLGRAGETKGVNYWTSRLDNKTNTRGQVMTGFSESNEYKTKQVSEVDVSVIFILLAGKAPTTTEFNDLVAELDALTTTPAAIAQAIIDSPEYATKIGG
jgi:titin